MKFNGEIWIRIPVSQKQDDEPDEFVIAKNAKFAGGLIPYARYGEAWTTTVMNRPLIREILLLLDAAQAPIDMILFCPKCHEQHIDAPEPDNCKNCGAVSYFHTAPPQAKRANGACDNFEPWLNAPHKKHRCHNCNHVFKPANVATNGVESLQSAI